MTWKNVKDFEGIYQINENGQIRRLKDNFYPCIGVNAHGYFQVSLLKDKRRYNKKVHRLLAEAFIENPKQLATVNHIDGNKLNNDLSNLEWMTHEENAKLGNEKSIIQYDKSGNYINTYRSALEAHRVTGIDKSNISGVCTGKRKSAGGYLWAFSEGGVLS